jgi:hypothetical protein
MEINNPISPPIFISIIIEPASDKSKYTPGRPI